MSSMGDGNILFACPPQANVRSEATSSSPFSAQDGHRHGSGFESRRGNKASAVGSQPVTDRVARARAGL